MSFAEIFASWFRKPKPKQPMKNPLIPAKGKITRYGYPNDETPDSLTEAGWGSFGNKLTPSALAISRDVEAAFVKAGIKAKGLVELHLANGRTLMRRWEDRTARTHKGKTLVGRFDIYCKDGGNKDLDGVVVTGFRKA